MLFSCQMKTDCRHSASSCLWGAKGPAMPPRWVWPRRRARPLDAAPGQRELGAGPRVRGERRPQVGAGRAGDRGRADRRVLGPRRGRARRGGSAVAVRSVFTVGSRRTPGPGHLSLPPRGPKLTPGLSPRVGSWSHCLFVPHPARDCVSTLGRKASKPTDRQQGDSESA